MSRDEPLLALSASSQLVRKSCLWKTELVSLGMLSWKTRNKVSDHMTIMGVGGGVSGCETDGTVVCPLVSVGVISVSHEGVEPSLPVAILPPRMLLKVCEHISARCPSVYSWRAVTASP
jgi:hypothetical protein